MPARFDIAIVLPIHNEEDGIANAIATIVKHIPETKTYQFICVDDGSTDQTWRKLTDVCKSENWNVSAIKFSRNFGKEAAIFAGLQQVDANCAIVMDSDLQHPPDLIPQFVKIWETGSVKVVEAVKISRGDESIVKPIFVKLYYKFLKQLTQLDLQTSSDYKLLDRAVIDHLLSLRESKTFFRANVSWFGFPSAKIPFSVAPRVHGTSSWSLKQNLDLGILGVTTFSHAPLKLTNFVGAIFLVLAAVIGSIATYHKLTGRAVEGFTTVILLQLIIGGLLFLGIGIVGRYLAIISDDLKGRPRFCVSESIKSTRI